MKNYGCVKNWDKVSKPLEMSQEKDVVMLANALGLMRPNQTKETAFFINIDGGAHFGSNHNNFVDIQSPVNRILSRSNIINE